MANRLANVNVDCRDPAAVARFWSALLGWPIAHEEPGETDVRSPSAPWTFDLVFAPVPEEKTGKNRVHLDLASDSPTHQLELVERAVALGATPADVGQRGSPWVVLADPEGNEFCVLEPRAEYAACGAIAAVVTDTADPAAAAVFWAEASGMAVAHTGTHAGLRPPPGLPWLEFLPTGEPKTVKHRVHVDVAPEPGGDPAAVVADLRARGATVLDEDHPWTVLADPQGNEFCVLSAAATGP
ncbi:VOC family protein [Pseudonocardia ailaonensis]|uniref:VOC family protein n=1 Tax=Pseudonocardia ailaonensis TaxID=367279 RepID=A0ABN2MXW9_9PSEU